MNKKLVLGSTVAGLLIFGIGSAAGASGSGKADATPAPAPTVTVTAEPSPQVTVTAAPEIKTVVKEVTPQVCLDALDQAAEAIGTLSEIPQVASDGLVAAYTHDQAGIDAMTEKVKGLNGKITDATPAIAKSSQACRAAAK